MRIGAMLGVILALLTVVGCYAAEQRTSRAKWELARNSWEVQFSSTEPVSEVVVERALKAYQDDDWPTRMAIQDAACVLPAGHALPLLLRLEESNWFGLVAHHSLAPTPPMEELVRRSTDEDIFAFVKAHPKSDVTALALTHIPEDRPDLMRRMLDEPSLADCYHLVSCNFACSTAPAAEIEERLLTLLDTPSPHNDSLAQWWDDSRSKVLHTLYIFGYLDTDRDHSFVNAVHCYQESHPGVELPDRIRHELDRIANPRSRKAAARVLKNDNKRRKNAGAD